METQSQAPETHTKRTVSTADRTRKFVERHIARGFKIVRCMTSDNDLISELQKTATNRKRAVVNCEMQVGVSLFRSGKKGVSLETLYTTYGVTYLEFTGTILVDSIGRRFHPHVSRLECGTWYWYVRNLAYVEEVNTIH